MDITWENDFSICVAAEGGEVRLAANRDGLISLARILISLAGEEPGAHIHLDEHNSLDEGSCGLVLERVE